MYYAYNTYIYAKMWILELLKAYLWCSNGGKAMQLMSVKDTGKVRNRQVAKPQIALHLILVTKFIP